MDKIYPPTNGVGLSLSDVFFQEQYTPAAPLKTLYVAPMPHSSIKNLIRKILMMWSLSAIFIYLGKMGWITGLMKFSSILLKKMAIKAAEIADPSEQVLETLKTIPASAPYARVAEFSDVTCNFVTKLTLATTSVFTITHLPWFVRGFRDLWREKNTLARDMVLIPYKIHNCDVEQVASFNTEVLRTKQQLVDCVPAVRTTFMDGSEIYRFWVEDYETLALFREWLKNTEIFKEFRINYKQLPELLNQKTLLAGKVGSGYVQEMNRLKRFLESDAKHSDTYDSLLHSGVNSAADTYTYALCRSTSNLEPYMLINPTF